MLKREPNFPSAAGWLAGSLALIALACFALPAGLSPDHETIGLSTAAGLGLLCALKAPARGREFLLAGLLAALFWMILAGRWHAGVSSGEIIAGRIPFNDQAIYVADAFGLLDGERLSAFSSRRPIHALVLAAFLKLGGGDFAIASALLPLFAALALTAFGLAVRHSHGLLAAWSATLLAALFYRRFIGTGLSEHAGFIFGCLAATLLWRGADSRSRPALYGGLFLLTIALAARAGCFFVLPPIGLWIAWILRRGRWPNGVALALAVGAIAAGFALNAALLHLFGTPGTSFANFPVTLYGLVAGGDWTRLALDHPEIAALPEAEAAPRILALVADRLRERPLALLNGIGRAWLAFFKTGSGQFAFLHHGWELQESLSVWLAGAAQKPPAWPKTLASLVYDDLPWLLSLAGIVAALRRPSEPRHLLILALWLGMLASIPFNPPWDSDSMRSYAATLPLQLLTVALGAAALARLVRPREVETVAGPGWSLTAGLLVAASLLPILGLVWLTASAPGAPATAACAAGPARPVQLMRGAEIRLTERRERFFDLPVTLFRTGGGEAFERYAQQLGPLLTLEPGTILLPVRVLDAREYQIVATGHAEAARALRAGPQLACPTEGGLLATFAEDKAPR